MQQRISLLLLAFVASFAWQQIRITEAVFQDVPNNHPNKVAIDFVQSKGIVSGYPDGTYQPDRLLNRAEFTKIIVESRFTKVEIDNCVGSEGFYKRSIFSDVESGVWFEKYICVAKKNNVIAGYPDGTFKPIQTINFAEAAKILANSYGLNIGSGDPWFTPFLQKLAELEAVPGTIASLRTDIDRAIKVVSRGEMAEVIYRLRSINDTVLSADGSFSIKIPEKALPDGVSITSISIEKLPVGEGPVEEVNGAPMVFYKLEPDGVKFREPVTFNVTTPTLKNAIPMVFLVSGEDFDLIPEPVIEIDQGLQRASLSGRLEHFSTLAIGFTNVFQISRKVIPDQPQRKKFEAQFMVERTSAPAQFSFPQEGKTLQLENGWSITNGVMTSFAENLTPHIYMNSPTTVLFNGPDSFTIKKIFQCFNNTPREASIRYWMNLNFIGQMNPGNDFGSYSAFISILSNKFKCLDETATIVDLEEPSPPQQASGANPFNIKCNNTISLLSEEEGGTRVEVLVITKSMPSPQSPNAPGICIPDYTQQGVDFYGPNDTCAENSWIGPSVRALDNQTYSPSSVAQYVTPGCGFGAVDVDDPNDKREAFPAYIYLDPEQYGNMRLTYNGTPVPPPPPPNPNQPPFNPDPSSMNCFGVTLGSSLATSTLVKVVKLPDGSCVRHKDLFTAGADVCGGSHYHALGGGSVKALCSGIYFDHAVPGIVPAACGYGRVDIARTGDIYVSTAYYNSLGYPN